MSLVLLQTILHALNLLVCKVVMRFLGQHMRKFGLYKLSAAERSEHRKVKTCNHLLSSSI